VFTARNALSPYRKQIRFVFKGLIIYGPLNCPVSFMVTSPYGMISGELFERSVVGSGRGLILVMTEVFWRDWGKPFRVLGFRTEMWTQNQWYTKITVLTTTDRKVQCALTNTVISFHYYYDFFDQMFYVSLWLLVFALVQLLQWNLRLEACC
jgi:hypothetical protein